VIFETSITELMGPPALIRSYAPNAGAKGFSMRHLTGA